MPRTVLRGARSPGDIAVEDGRIVGIGTLEEPVGQDTITIDCGGGILTAGLVNSHHHTPTSPRRSRSSTTASDASGAAPSR